MYRVSATHPKNTIGLLCGQWKKLVKVAADSLADYFLQGDAKIGKQTRYFLDLNVIISERVVWMVIC